MAEKVDIWMPMYWPVFLAATTHLSTEEKGAYLLLIGHTWMNGPLPKDVEHLRRIAGIEKKPWPAMWSLLRGFWTETEAGYIQKRTEKERTKAQQNKVTNAVRNEARWGETTSERGREMRSQRMSEARRKGTHTALEWELLKAFHGGQCLRCGMNCDPVKDHIVPVYQGGSDGIDNIQPLCRKCNASKGPDTTDHRKVGWLDALQVASKMPLDTPLNASTVPVPVTDSSYEESLSGRESASPSPGLNLGPAAREIACAHPWAVARQMKPGEVDASDVVAVVRAIQTEARDCGVSTEIAAQALLQFTRSYAEAVATWPLGDHRFVIGIEKFFKSFEYRKDPQTWRRDATNQQAGKQPGSRTRTASEQRHADGLAKVLDAFSDVVGATGDAGFDGAGDGELRDAGDPGRMGVNDPITLDGDRAAVWH